MARTFKLVSGSDEVNLIETDPDTGIIFSRGGAGPNKVTSKLTMTSSPLADGGNLRMKRMNPIAETYRLNLKALSHDSLATQLQALQRILRKGDQNALTTWQQEPLYIQQQTTNETNSRKSKVLAWNSEEISDFFNQPIESSSQIDNFRISLVREPYWRGTAPGSMPSAEAVNIPDFPWFDQYGGTRANFKVTGESAQEGDWGAEITVNGIGSEVDGQDNLPDSETTATIEFQIDFNDLTMADTETFNIIHCGSDGTGGLMGIIILGFLTATDYNLRLVARDDAGANLLGPQITGFSGEGTKLIRLEFLQSSAPGADDGFLKMYVDDVLVDSLTGLDNDTHTFISTRLGSVANVSAGTSGTFYIDRYRWDGSIDPSTYERTIDFEQIMAPMPNHRQSTGVISHIYAEDNSATGFSGNLVFEPNWEWFVVSGSTPAVNDAMYFGADEPFYNLVFFFKVAGDVDVAVDAEYSKGGGAWDTSGGLEFDVQWLDNWTGMVILSFNGKSNVNAWAVDTVNAIANKFWVRIILTTVTTWTTAPQQGNQIVYTANSPYLEFNNLQVHGDAEALMMQRLFKYAGTVNKITEFIAGFKSRGLDTFVSRLNAGDDNPTGWAESYGADTSKVSDESAPGGNIAKITFATFQTMVDRITWTLSASTGVPSDYEGTYRIYLRAFDDSGLPGATSLRLKVQYLFTTVGEKITMSTTDLYSLIDLGVFTIQGMGILGDEVVSGGVDLKFILQAQESIPSALNLSVFDLILIPIDEMNFATSWNNLTDQEVDADKLIQIDGGLLREGVLMSQKPTDPDNIAPGSITPFSSYDLKGVLPTVEPRRNGRIYYVFHEQATNANDYSLTSQGQVVGVDSYLHEIWNTMRGLD